MTFYNVYIHKKLWGKDLLPSNPLFPPSSFRDIFEKFKNIKKMSDLIYSFMVEIKVVRNVILNNVDLPNQLSRMHGSVGITDQRWIFQSTTLVMQTCGFT